MNFFFFFTNSYKFTHIYNQFDDAENFDPNLKIILDKTK